MQEVIRTMDNLFIGVFLCMLGTSVGSVGALFLKLTSKNAQSIKLLLKKKEIYIGISLYGLSALIFVYSLKFGDLSTLYPIVGSSYVWIALLSVRFLKEKMNEIKWFGILLILVGVILIGLGG